MSEKKVSIKIVVPAAVPVRHAVEDNPSILQSFQFFSKKVKKGLVISK